MLDVSNRFLRGISAWVLPLMLSMLFIGSQAEAQVCAAPGASGGCTVSALNTVLNTYYPGTAAGGAAAGTTIGYNSAAPTGAGTAIAAGDLILIIQMQDGTGGTAVNNNTYAFPATAAGRYEFARVLSLGTNVLNLTTALSNAYTQNTAAANNQTYQVIRVPQCSAMTINVGASVVPYPWDGTTGGIVAADISGAFTNNGAVNASYAGFRGSAAQRFSGTAGAVDSTATVFDYMTTASNTAANPNAHGGKGEGTAGTPDTVLRVYSAPGVLQVASGNITTGGSTLAASSSAYTNTTGGFGSPTTISQFTTQFLITTGRSYNGGNRAAGAPGNAGGGGTDGRPSANPENSGGGGGSNIGAGGTGGNNWDAAADYINIGGRGGNAVADTLANKLVLGGGGGSGTADSTDTAGNGLNGLDGSGGAGGGMIFIKAGTVGGSGSLQANGQAGRNVLTGVVGVDAATSRLRCSSDLSNRCDAAGGGGGGGTIAVLASSGSIASAQAIGGQGGNVSGPIHGPGGGGGGGYIVASTGIAIGASSVAAGNAGVANAVSTTVSLHGATTGTVGSVATQANASIPANAGGLPANCLPSLSTSKITSTPAGVTTLVPPYTTTYSIVVRNTSTVGDARGVTLYDPLLPLGQVSYAAPPGPTVTFSATPSVCGLGTRTSTSDPATGSTQTFTASAFNIPGGCVMTYTFSAFVPASMPSGTYNNSAVAYFTDPSDAGGVRTVTTSLPPAASALVANTSFTTGGTVGGTNYDGNNAANTGEDIKILPTVNLSITKTNGVNTVTAGTTISYTVTVSNLGPSSANNSVVKDPAATGLNCTAVSCSVASGAAVCPAVSVASLQGAGVTVASFPPNSSLNFVVTCGVTATGQ